METKGQTEARGAVLQKLLKNRLVLLLLAAGLLLLLLPSGGGTKKTGDAKLTEPAFSVTDEEARLADALGQISGVGRVKVLLSVEGSAQRQLAQSEEKTLVVSENGSESVVDLHYVNPEYKGAVVVCEGADDAAAKLAVLSAVEAYTGLTSDRVTVMKMN